MKKTVPTDAILIPDNATKVFGGIIFDVYQWSQGMFDGTTETFEMLKRPDTVVIMAIVEDKIIVLNETQPHAGERINLIAGRVDLSDSSTLTAAQRETKEETGYEFSNWKLVDVYQPQAKIERFNYIYVAWGVITKGEAHLDAGEKISLNMKNFDEVKEMAQQGVGYMDEARNILEQAAASEGLISLPEFIGKEADR